LPHRFRLPQPHCLPVLLHFRLPTRLLMRYHPSTRLPTHYHQLPMHLVPQS